jgi:glycosyltransferase involved in cell wall biosynthesis
MSAAQSTARSTPATLRVLLAYRGDVDTKGGAALVMEQTGAALRKLGVEVDCSFDTYPSLAGYDLVQAFNAWRPDSALEQLRHLRGSGVPVVWQPFYLHWQEAAWASLAVRAVLSQDDVSLRAKLLEELRCGRVVVNGMTQHGRNEIIPGFDAMLCEMVDCVDHLCVVGNHEMQKLAQVTRLSSKPYTIVPHGVDAEIFAKARPDAFVEYSGLRDFVLCVGALDARKNQALLAEALRETELPLVLVGPCFEPDYRQVVLAHGGERLVHFERLPRELIASAYKAASVHVLPSFAEASALANMEAAAAGCPIVVSNRSSEFEYFGDLAYYCDPSDARGIREAILLARERREAERERWQELAGRMREFSWERTALATLTAYRRALAAAGGALVPEARRFLTISFAEELVSAPEQLGAYAEVFSPSDDATLLILVPPGTSGELDRLEQTVAAAGLDGESTVDMIACAIPEHSWGALAARADALYSCSEPPGGFTGLPRFGPAQARELRRFAGLRELRAAS